MLEVIRSRSKSLIVLLIFGVIILVFVFWGVGPSGNSGGGGSIASVDGQNITFNDYQRLYNRQLEYLKQEMGEKFNADFLEGINLKERTIGILINNILMIEAAKDEDVRVTDDEVQQNIMLMAVFKKDEAFDKDTYFRILKENRIAVADFEVGIRQELLLEKVRRKVMDKVTVSDEDAWNEFARANRQVAFDYIALSSDDQLSKVEVTDEDVKEYYDKNGSEYTLPTKINVIFAKIFYNDLNDEVNIPEEDIKNYYEDNSADFMQQKRVRARHILFRPDPKDAEGDEVGASRRKADSILAEIKAGGDFAALAKEHSADKGSGKKGGDLGYFVEGKMVKPFEDAVFALGKGEMSEVVETRFGFHIIRVEDIKEAGPLPYKSVRSEIEDVFIKNETYFLAHTKMEELGKRFDETETADGIRKAAKEAGVMTDSAYAIAEFDTEGEILSDAMLKSAAFGLDRGGVSAPVEVEGGLYVIKVLERAEEHIPSLDSVRPMVEMEVKFEKAVTAAIDEAEAILKRLVDGEALSKVAAEKKIKVETTALTARADGFIKEINLFVKDRESLFTLTEEAPVYSEVVAHGGKFYLFSRNNSVEANRGPFEKGKDAFKAQLLQMKRTQGFNAWLDNLRSNAEVSIKAELL